MNKFWPIIALWLPLSTLADTLPKAYQWRDDQGKIVFSDSPPKDRPHKTLDIAATAVPPHRLFWRIGSQSYEYGGDAWQICSIMKANQVWHRKNPRIPGHEFGFSVLIRTKCKGWEEELQKLESELGGQ